MAVAKHILKTRQSGIVVFSIVLVLARGGLQCRRHNPQLGQRLELDCVISDREKMAVTTLVSISCIENMEYCYLYKTSPQHPIPHLFHDYL
jgi:hypothetical protein